MKKIKSRHPEDIDKDYGANTKLKKKLLKQIMHNYSEFELSEFELSCTRISHKFSEHLIQKHTQTTFLLNINSKNRH